MSHWTPAFPLEDLEPGSAKLLKTDTHRVALFRTDAGEVFAVDNACPHEGYPLVQGEVKGCTLTCQWHNFKFDLRDGACLKGDEDVPHYATRIEDGTIEVDLTREDPARVIEKAKSSLEEGMVEGQLGRMARDVARLLQAGMPAVEILSHGAMLDARYAEYGTTHALPVATDLIEFLSGEIENDTLVILQLMELASEGAIRRPRQQWPQPQQSERFAEELVEAIENEDATRAIALVRGHLAEAPQALLRAASEHFLGFGHPLIYATKTIELLQHHDAHRDDILSALTLRLVSSTREDTLPPMARWRRRVDAGEFRRGSERLEDKDEIVRRILDAKDKTIEEEFADLINSTEPNELVDVLVEAAARRMLNFDASIHEDPHCQDNWLFVTHPLTYAHAIREALEHSTHPAILKNLIWSLAFIRRSHRLELPDRVAPLNHPPARPEDVIAALEAQDPRVVDVANACTDDLGLPLRRWLLGGRATRPIYVAHQIKTLRVALQETRTPTPVLATLRMLATPMTERSLTSLAHEATQLVVHGNLPKVRAV
jgi:nitrite reductase/ring-hydroxylating ferredoxin subunit/DNA-binding GntR family transcriptional regulator